jgi:hypothetical protein
MTSGESQLLRLQEKNEIFLIFFLDRSNFREDNILITGRQGVIVRAVTFAGRRLVFKTKAYAAASKQFIERRRTYGKVFGSS